jgi:tetratricopeptide (TPR) repeat protein
MVHHFMNFFLHRSRIVLALISLLASTSITVIFIMLPISASAYQLRLATPASISAPSPQVTPVPTVIPTPTNVTSSQDSQVQVLSEAQNDVSIANTIISWSGFFLAIVATAVSVAGFFGVREFRRIHQLRTEFESHIQQVTTLEKQVEKQLGQLAERFERESQTLMEASYNFSVATEAYTEGNNARAIEYYLKALQLQPMNVRVMERLGRAYSNLNQINKAEHYLKQALNIDPVNVPALRGLAACYRYTDREQAIKYLERGLEIDPLHYEGWDYLGLLYRDGGQTDQAISAHERALAIKKRPETEFFLSILYSQKGDRKRAKFMALAAEHDLDDDENSDRIRPVWKDLIYCGACIMEGNKEEALQAAQTLTPYMTTQRVYDGLMSHLLLMLEATDHKIWIPLFTNTVKVKQKEDATA